MVHLEFQDSLLLESFLLFGHERAESIDHHPGWQRHPGCLWRAGPVFLLAALDSWKFQCVASVRSEGFLLLLTRLRSARSRIKVMGI